MSQVGSAHQGAPSDARGMHSRGLPLQAIDPGPPQNCQRLFYTLPAELSFPPVYCNNRVVLAGHMKDGINQRCSFGFVRGCVPDHDAPVCTFLIMQFHPLPAMRSSTNKAKPVYRDWDDAQLLKAINDSKDPAVCVLGPMPLGIHACDSCLIVPVATSLSVRKMLIKELGDSCVAIVPVPADKTFFSMSIRPDRFVPEVLRARDEALKEFVVLKLPADR
jgi:hypothetical protein